MKKSKIKVRRHKRRQRSGGISTVKSHFRKLHTIKSIQTDIFGKPLIPKRNIIKRELPIDLVKYIASLAEKDEREWSIALDYEDRLKGYYGLLGEIPPGLTEEQQSKYFEKSKLKEALKSFLEEIRFKSGLWGATRGLEDTEIHIHTHPKYFAIPSANDLAKIEIGKAFCIAGIDYEEGKPIFELTAFWVKSPRLFNNKKEILKEKYPHYSDERWFSIIEQVTWGGIEALKQELKDIGIELVTYHEPPYIVKTEPDLIEDWFYKKKKEERQERMEELRRGYKFQGKIRVREHEKNKSEKT
jgi:hypothetical protein